MRFISSKTHGLMDYLMGLLLMIAPYLLGFYGSNIASNIFIAMGVILLIYSLLTKYEYGFLKIISFDLHLIFDLVSGLFLATSPWLFHFNDVVYIPHLVFGSIEIIAALTTRKVQNNVRNNQ